MEKWGDLWLKIYTQIENKIEDNQQNWLNDPIVKNDLDQGLKWEMIKNKKGKNKENLYTLRITQKCRSIAIREGNYLRLLSLHTDHDSAYK